MQGRRARARRGLTLLEIVLALSLLVLLAGLTIGALWGTLESTRITEHGSRMKSLLRTARAEAANNGKRLRLSFDPETTQPIVSIELDPLGEPGAFVPYRASWVKLAALEGDVRVTECHLTGVSDFTEISAGSPGESADEFALAEITFYPDGSSDSARIVLANDNEDRPWHMEVTLNGVDGSVQTRQFDPDEEESLDDEEVGRPEEPAEPPAGGAGR